MAQRRTQRSDAAQAYRRWYKTARWRARREAQLSAKPLCERCEGQGRVTPATVAHHKIPHRGNPELFWHGDLASSCAPCHDVIEQKIEALGYVPGSDAKGRPLDPDHPWNR